MLFDFCCFISPSVDSLIDLYYDELRYYLENMMSIFSKIFGDPNQKELDKLQPLVERINELEKKVAQLSEEELKNKTLSADILITAVGQPFFITAKMVKEGVIVIDVGTNKIDSKHIVGDVDYTDVFSKASHITPVPGGVGPMTVAMLLYNTVQLTKK